MIKRISAFAFFVLFLSCAESWATHSSLGGGSGHTGPITTVSATTSEAGRWGKISEPGSMVKAAILDTGDGLYLTTGLTFDKPGDWEISVTVTKGGKSDRALFSFPHVLTHLPQFRN